MAKQYNVIIFGASGYTGQYVLEEVLKSTKEVPSLTFAVAGRSASKLEQFVKAAKENCGINIYSIGIIIADVNDYKSLVDMAEQGIVVINCVGPYRFYGESVTKACIEGKADCIDISGEPQFLETVQLKYSEEAKEKGVHIIGSCGFDSAPADLGTLYLQEHFPGDLNSVDIIVGLQDSSQGNACINFTTLECAVHGFYHKEELKDIRRKLFDKPVPHSTYRVKSHSSLFWSDETQRWCLPNLSSDRSVVIRSQRLLHELKNRTPTQFPEFFSFGTFKRGGPKREELKKIRSFIALIGQGWNTKLDPETQHSTPPSVKKIAWIKGPEPGYISAAIIASQCALTVLQEKEKLTHNSVWWSVIPPPSEV